MQLVEQHITKSKEWENWCIKSKNLYNQTLYYWRQSIFGNIEYFSEYEILKLFRKYNEPSFRALPSHCGQETIKRLFENIKSWQKAKKEYSKNPSKFLNKPRLPKYKKDLFVLGFNNFQVKLKNGYIHFPKIINVAPIKTNITNINCCRVIPKSNHFVVEFVYTITDVKQKEYKGKALGIDLGMNNLASCVSTFGNSFIINGKPLKSINQFYNKRKAELQSKLSSNIFTSKRIEKLTLSRKNKIKNYIHHASKYIIKTAEDLNVTKIVIGNNKQWKTNITLGKRTNQNFVSLPFSHLISKIEYKAKMVGIEVLTTEESYTSKCSAIDLEPINKHTKYVGRRTKRGLFKTLNGTYLNADCNGSLNILRKVLGDFEMNDSIVSALVAPSKINLFKQNRVKTKSLINNIY
jgi:putative transposase